MTHLYRVTVVLEIDARDEEQACQIAEAECPSCFFVTCETVTEIEEQHD